MIFILLLGVFSPSYGPFMYAFQMDIIKLSKFQYGALHTVSLGTAFLGSFLFNTFLRNIEFRSLLCGAFLIRFLASLCYLVLIKQWNHVIGIPDVIFIIIIEVVFSTLLFAFKGLPMLVLLAKVTPKRVEGSCFALLMSTLNFSS